MTFEAFQSWVIQTGLVVSLLILLILIIRRPFARMFGANAAYALWSLPLIRLCLPALSVPQSWVPEMLRQNEEPSSPAIIFEPSVSPLPVSGDSVGILAPSGLTPPEPDQMGVILICVWLSVAGLWMAYQLVQQIRFKSHLRINSAAPNSGLLVAIEKAAQTVGLKTSPQLRVAAGQTGPFVTGVINPLVIVPNNFDVMFDVQQQHFALVHEFAHIKRRDLWVALATLVFRAVNWPNPLVHYASHKLRGDQEAACDAFVVKVTGGKTAHSYAETLVKAVRQEGGMGHRNAHLALSLTETKSEISKGD